MGPLKGVRVLDLTSVLMGPYATQILGDLGADVIKIESPDGDPVRHYKPAKSPLMPAVFLNLHRNKRSLSVDLKSADGKQVFLDLLDGADVVVHNMRAKAAARLGLDYQTLADRRPGLVYCIANGFGQGGPYADLVAYDDMIQAASGLVDFTGHVAGQPQYVPTAICDKVTGLVIVYSIIAALFHRQRTGAGQRIEVPMFETNVAFNLLEHISGFAYDPPMTEPGFARFLTPMRRPYRTADGHACIMPYSDRNWSDFFDFVGHPELAEDPRFATFSERSVNIDALYAHVANLAPRHTTADWMAFCKAHSIAAMPVRSFRDLWQDPHLKAVAFFRAAEHPSEGRYHLYDTGVRFSATPTAVTRHAPHVGQDSVAILREAGFGEDRIRALIDNGVVKAPPQDQAGDAARRPGRSAPL